MAPCEEEEEEDSSSGEEESDSAIRCAIEAEKESDEFMKSLSTGLAATCGFV